MQIHVTKAIAIISQMTVVVLNNTDSARTTGTI